MIGFVKQMIARRKAKHEVLAPLPRPEPTIAPLPEHHEARLYVVTKKHVERAERTGSYGPDKHAFVVAAVTAEFRDRGWPDPLARDLRLAIEVAVREIHGSD